MNLYEVVVGQQSVRILFKSPPQLFCKCFKKWPPVAILDVQKHFVSHFLPFQINTTIFIFVIFFYKMAASGHFGCPKITFGRIFGHFRSIRNFFCLNIFYKMATSGHFGCVKITFDLISIHFTSIRNFNFFCKFLTKWLTSAILDVRNSFSN